MESHAPHPEPTASRLPPWLAAMRPEHWVKNILLFLAIPFAGRMSDPAAYLACGLGFAAFCLLSSCVYLVNDIRDRTADAVHPVKRHRPIASGRLTVPAAWVQAAMLLAAAAALGTRLGLAFGLLEGAYLVLMLAYTFCLKHHAIVDVIAIAMGFVFRAMASAAALGVPSSAYLVLCTFMLCLFIALSKRRGEVADMPSDEAPLTRRVNLFYTPQRTEHMLSVSAGLSIVTYALYCVAPQTVEHIGSKHMVWTVPLVVYAMFRFYCLTARAGQQDPVRVLMRDKVLWLTGLLWLAAVAAVIHFGPREGSAAILV
jgi:4-hydroxybenzoate polyprenyltransferase